MLLKIFKGMTRAIAKVAHWTVTQYNCSRMYSGMQKGGGKGRELTPILLICEDRSLVLQYNILTWNLRTTLFRHVVRCSLWPATQGADVSWQCNGIFWGEDCSGRHGFRELRVYLYESLCMWVLLYETCLNNISICLFSRCGCTITSREAHCCHPGTHLPHLAVRYRKSDYL